MRVHKVQGHSYEHNRREGSHSLRAASGRSITIWMEACMDVSELMTFVGDLWVRARYN